MGHSISDDRRHRAIRSAIVEGFRAQGKKVALAAEAVGDQRIGVFNIGAMNVDLDDIANRIIEAEAKLEHDCAHGKFCPHHGERR